MTDQLGLLRSAIEDRESGFKLERFRLLLVEDNRGDARLVEEAFHHQAREAQTDWDYQITVVDRLSAATHEIAGGDYQLVLLDMGLPDSQGLDTVLRMREADPDTPIIVLTGHDDYEMAVRTLRAGAQDYLVKGRFDHDALTRSVRYALERARLADQLAVRETLNRRILSSLSAHIAVLDSRGQIIQVNSSWEQFSRENGGDAEATGVGANYLEACRNAAAVDESGSAQQAIEVLEAVLSGASQFASMEYPCHSPETERWFTLRATPLEAETAGDVVVAHENITERRLAEFRLEQRSQEIQTLVENSPDIVSRVDLKGRVLYISPAVKELTGVSPEEYIGREIPQIADDENRKNIWLEALERISRTGQEQKIEFEMSGSQGTRVFQSSLVPERSSDGSVRTVLAVSRDITELKAANAQIEAREQVLKAVSFTAQLYLSTKTWQEATDRALEQLGIAVGAHRAYVWRNEMEAKRGLVTSQVAEWASDPGLALGETEPLPYQELGFERWKETFEVGRIVEGPIDEFPREEFEFLQQQAIKSLLVVPIYVRDEWWGFIGFDDVETARHWDDTIIEALKTAAATLGGAVAHDRAREYLARREERFRALVENSWDAVAITSADATITFASRAGVRLLGYSAEEMIGMSGFDLVHPDDLQEVQDAFATLLAEGREGQPLEVRVRQANGEFRWMEIIGSDLRDAPEVEGVVINFRDISQQYQARLAVERSERHLRSVLENISDLIAILDREGVIRYLSPNAAQILDESAEKIIGQNILILLPPDDRTNIRDVIDRAWENPGEKHMVRYQWELPSGERLEFEALGSVEPDSEGKLGLLVSARDISHQRKLEQRLARERDRFELLTQTSPTAIALLDQEGTITFGNPEAERVLGLERSKLEGQTYNAPTWDIRALDGSPFPEEQLPFAQVMRENQPVFDIRLAISTPEGGRKLLSVNAAPVKDDNGNVTSVVTNFQDITQQVGVEERIKASERRFRSLVQNAADIITIVDAEGTVLYESPALESVLGYKPAEVIGLNVLEPVHPEDKANAIAWLERIVESPESSIQFSMRVFSADGQPRYLEVMGTNMLDDPAVGGIVLNSRDITDRRTAEMEVIASEERYRSLFNSMRDAIIVADEDRRIIQCNPAFTEIFGYELAEIRGQSTELIYEDTSEFKDMADKIQVGRSRSEVDESVQTLSYRRKSGEVFRGETHVHDLKTSQGETIGRIGLIRDITDKERQERERQAIVQMAEALRAASSSEEMPPIILSELMKLLDAGGTEMVLYDAEFHRLWVELGWGSWAHFAGKELDIPGDIAWQVIEEGKAFRTDDLRKVKDFDSAHLIGEDLAAAAVPLRAGEDRIGVLWAARPSPLTDDEISLMKAISDMTGNALRRAGLHEETQRRAEQMAAVSLLGQEMAEKLDEFAIYERMVAASKRLLSGVSTVIISRFNSAAEQFYCVYGEHEGEIIDIGELEPVPLEPPGSGCQSEAVHQRRPVFKNDLIQRGKEDPSTIRGGDERHTASGLYVPMILDGEVIGVLQAQSYFVNRFTELDGEILALVANTAAVALANAELLRETQGSAIELAMAYDTTLEGWAKALELRDKETEGHTRRVTDMTVRLAARLGVAAGEIVQFRRGALMHDIGKMGIPDEILLKPGKLTDAEWEIMRQHPQMAYDMLEQVDFLRPALDIPLYHHERWNGSGYPEGLAGEDIPICARIFAVVDVFDALSSDRPYRKAWSPEKVRSYMRENAGVEFDPAVVEAFFEMIGADGSGI